VTCGTQYFPAGFDSRLCVVGPCKRRRKEGGQPVADEFFDERIVSKQGLCPGDVKAVDQIAVFLFLHPFSQRCRAADIGEQDRDLDLCPAGKTLREAFAGVAEVRVHWGGSHVEQPPGYESADPVKWNVADMTTRFGGQCAIDRFEEGVFEPGQPHAFHVSAGGQIGVPDL
jgi:hypothetical protein